MLGPLSPAKKRRECFPVLSATFWATVCTYPPIYVFRDEQTPSHGLIVDETAPRVEKQAASMVTAATGRVRK